VLAIDVGHGQLDWTLRNDPRVTNWEKTHIGTLSKETLGRWLGTSAPPLVVVDLSFISLERVGPALASLFPVGTDYVVLVKPQFEADPQDAPKGVVRDPSVRESILHRLEDLSPGWGLRPRGTMTSPITGREGNVEFFLYLVKDKNAHD
jgi:23S rRNA (cytidine1920-2'-O)/16S rRNA (cytidine1409-2'-O)-methyltransferase